MLGMSSYVSAQCPDDNVYSGLNVSVTACPGGTSVTLDAGQSATFSNVVQGNVYTFSTCGNTACDTYLTLSDGTGTSYAFNDDAGACSPQSEITWQAPFSGSLLLNLDAAGCANTGCTGVQIDISCAIPPAFSDCDGAVTLPVSVLCNFQTFDNSLATTTALLPPPWCPTFTSNDVWFNFTVPASGAAFIDMQAGSMTDAIFAVYPVPCNAITNPALCVDDDLDPMPSANVTYPPGTQLWVRVWGANGQTGTFDICITEDVPTITASDCVDAVEICDNNGFTIDPNGVGTINEIPAVGGVSNPNVPPGGSGNMGCLLIGESNSTWMLITIGTTGNLAMTFGGGGAQAGYYDWIMYPYSASTCNDIPNNLVAPVRCNWNSNSTGGTGMADPLNLPAGGFAGNYEPLLPVTCGDQYMICFSNYSSASSTVPVDFGGSTAAVMCANALVVSSAGASICIGDAATLTAAGGYTYVWSPGTGLSGTTGATVTAMPTSTQSYTVTGTDTTGCITDSYYVTVTVNPAAILDIQYLDPITGVAMTGNPTICEGESIVLNGLGSGQGYTWSPGTGLSGTSTQTVTATPTGTTTYQVDGATGFGCPGNTTVTVIVVPPPTVTVTSPNPNCNMITGEATATASNGTAGYLFLWSNSATANDPTSSTINGLPDNLYSVTVQDANGCEATGSVNVIQPPAMSITQVCVDASNIGMSDGSSSVTVTGGSTAYTYYIR